MSSYSLRDIAPIGPDGAEKLEGIGIRTTGRLLDRALIGHADIAARCGVATEVVDSWVATARLLRVKGIGKDFCALLHAVGVVSVDDLLRADPAALVAAATAANKERPMVRQVPTYHEIARWIAAARGDRRAHPGAGALTARGKRLGAAAAKSPLAKRRGGS